MAIGISNGFDLIYRYFGFAESHLTHYSVGVLWSRLMHLLQRLWHSPWSARLLCLALGGVFLVAGALKLTVPAFDLREAPTKPDRSRPRPAATVQESLEVAVQTSDNTCDLRGLRVDEGIAMMESFLDRAVGEGLRTAFLIHGHGTGALRDAIRKQLESSPYVRTFRPGDRHEGGDGVSVVWLR